MPSRVGPAALAAAAWAALYLGPGLASAQTTDSGRQTGLHFFAVENLETRQVEQRGIAGANGVAFSNLILRPNTRYRLWILQAATLRVGRLELTSPANGVRFQLPEIRVRPASSFDADNDGLHDQGEFILGTDPRNPDTDGDGVADGAEVLQGLDPLDGLPARTGIVASVDTPGEAVDVVALNDFAVVADGNGISVFNVFNRLNPQTVARVALPGYSSRVAVSGTLVAVASAGTGVSILDVSDPPAARVVQRIERLLLGGGPTAVAVVGDVLFTGTTSGEVVAIDLKGGGLLVRRLLGEPVQDLAVERGVLFAQTYGKVFALRIGEGGLLGPPTSVTSEHTGQPRRLFAGGGILYSVHFRGYNTFDTRGPTLLPIQPGVTSQFGWKQLALNGSGLGVAAVGPNSTPDGPHDLSVYDTRDPTQTNVFRATFPTPGSAQAVTIYNGLAYAADNQRGLQVVNYLSYDTQGIAPLITLTTSFAGDQVEEGKFVWVAAEVLDDVQVRNVEFYLDGQKVLTDGSFPFELSLTTPRRSQQTSFTLRARVSDTGGNRTWSELRTITLTADQTAPTVFAVSPPAGAVLGSRPTVAAFTSEPLLAASVRADTFTLVHAGPDGALGSGDDVPIAAAHELRPEVRGVFLVPPGPLASGLYRATLTTGITDQAGVPLAAPRTWDFRVYDVAMDRDGDGVPDDLELALGLNPDSADSDNDGIPDGQEDHDGDGLTNAAEVVLNLDPRSPDSNMNGVLDGAEDPDQDGLTHAQEIAAATDPYEWDTDGDSFSDGDEVAEGSNPLDPQSTPLRHPLTVVGVKNQAGPPVATSQTSVKNQAAPEAIEGRTEARPVSVRNQ